MYKELLVYANELDRAKSFLQELLQEYFINTATGYGLYLREKIFGTIKEELSPAQRREILISRFSVKTLECNKSAIESALVSAGIIGYTVEDPLNNSIYINCLNRFDTTITQETAKNIVLKLIPAHLSVDYDFRVITWNYIDDLDLDFSTIDAADLTWDEADNYTTQL